MPSIKATFPSVRASLAELRILVKKFARDQGLSEAEIIDVLIAVSEACSNAVLYAPTVRGYQVNCDYEHGVLTVKVRDFGAGFSLEAKDSDVEPRQQMSGGLGIHIMRVLMDKVTYEIEDPGTTVTLVKSTRSPIE